MAKKNNKKRNSSQDQKADNNKNAEEFNEMKSAVSTEEKSDSEMTDQQRDPTSDNHKSNDSRKTISPEKNDLNASNRQEDSIPVVDSLEKKESEYKLNDGINENDNSIESINKTKDKKTTEGKDPITSNDTKKPIKEIGATGNNDTPENKTDTKTTRKRLTLQERLALAAKGKSKKHESPSSTPPPTPVANVLPASEVSEPVVESIEKESEGVEDSGNSKSLEGELKQLKSELIALNLKNQDLNNKIKSSNNSEKSNITLENSIRELNEKLSKKDDTIEQLLKEGEVLSKKELKLNETIKRLKSLNSDLDTSLKEYSSQNDEMAMQFSELEDFLKVHNFKSIEYLLSSYSENLTNLQRTTESLNKEKDEGWEKKYQELQTSHNKEVLNREKVSKETQELKIQFEMLKKQHSLELEQKDSLINDLKRNMKSLKDEKNEEIDRLENKIELLRVENESLPGALSGNDFESSNSSKIVDYDEFFRLSETHHKLQQQHLSSQEVWKLVESNLLNKVDTLTASLESLKKGNLKLSNELRKAQGSMQNYTEELKKANKVISELENESKDLKFQVDSKNNELKEEQERFDKFRQIYNADRDNLNIKIKNLTETLEDSKTAHTNQANKQDSYMYNLDPRNPIRTLSSNSVLEFSGNYNWSDIKLGESSTTPAISKDVNSFMDLNHNHSQLSFTEIDEEGELDDFKSQVGSSGMSITGTIPSTSIHNNIQFISKMSSNIRRLEVELNTLREENNQLSSEKEATQKELLKMISLDDVIEVRNKKIYELNEEIQQRALKEQTMLELIGEKSEQVEELMADVQDLKDLCKLQVQQMIELQESK